VADDEEVPEDVVADYLKAENMTQTRTMML